MIPVPSRLPARWTQSHVDQLHPVFWSWLVLPIRVMTDYDLYVVPISLHRPNAQQKRLRDEYERQLKLWEENKLDRKPLPAAKPGASAHNFDLCSKNLNHDARGADGLCPVCGSVLKPASLAADVGIMSSLGILVSSGGSLPLKDRPWVWQVWAQTLQGFPKLRDGGTFSNPDTPHVELAAWDFRTGTLKKDA